MSLGSLTARLLVTLLVVAAALTLSTTGIQAVASSGGDRSFVGDPPMLSTSSKAMFHGPPMVPGERRTGCAILRNDGSSPARVALLGRTGGTGLDQHLELTVLRGGGGCGRFRPDPVDHVGLGAGVLYRGTLRAFPDDAPSALADPGSWLPGESRVYRFVVRLPADAPQGLTATQRFIWHGSSA